MTHPSYLSGLALVACLASPLPACSGSTSVPTRIPTDTHLFEEHAQVAEGAALTLPPLNGSLYAYLAFAVENSPAIRAAFEDWRASVFASSRAERLPEPTLSVGYFVRSIETRVGPQRYNLSVSQMLPWFGKRAAAKAASSEQSHARALIVDAQVLALKREVATHYWALWRIKEEHRLKAEHDVVLESLAATVRGRLLTGSASLADLSQVELTKARHHDHEYAHQEQTRISSARLLALLGTRASSEALAIGDTPMIGLPLAGEQELSAMASRHPMVGRHQHLARSEQHKATAERIDREPRFTVGANLIGVGEANTPGVADSGKDALVVSAGMSLPLWVSSYGDAEQAARAAAASHRAMEESSRRQIEADLSAALAALRDTHRRIELYRTTLIPQAQTTLQAVIGGYRVKSSTVAAVLLAQKDLIELQLEHVQAQAMHATTWASLEYLVGSSLATKDTSHE